MTTVEYAVTIMTVMGGNCAIKRKGKIIKLIADSEMNMTELGSRPKIQDGDVFITGKGSAFTVSSNPDSWKEYDKNKRQRSKYITLFPNSEAKVKIEVWKGHDNKSDQDLVCFNMIDVELAKGTFSVSYEGYDDELITPTATLKANDKALWCIDIQSNGSYIFKGFGAFEVKNRKTGKSYLAKNKFQEEVIVTGDSIYQKPITKMDTPPTGMITAPMGGMGIFKDSKEQAGKQADMAKNFGSIADQASVAMEMMKRMSPDQMAEMSKNMTPEQKKQFKEGMAQMKKMEASGKMDEMKKAMEIGKAHIEGMGSENLDKFRALSERGIDKAQGVSKQIEESINKVELPRQYGPLKSEFKVA